MTDSELIKQILEEAGFQISYLFDMMMCKKDNCGIIFTQDINLLLISISYNNLPKKSVADKLVQKLFSKDFYIKNTNSDSVIATFYELTRKQ